MLKLKQILLCTCFIVFGTNSFAQKFDIILDVKLSASAIGKKINVATVSVFKDGVKSDSTVTQNGRCKFTFNEGSVYKIVFEKTGHTAKHLLLETRDIPPSAKKRQVVKIEVALFAERKGLHVEFLEDKPMGIARYESIYKKIKWDDDYTRIMEEKIIEATIDYAKRKQLGEIK